MPRIRCHYTDCIFLDEGYCSAAAVEIDPDTGCVTYSPNEESMENDDWEDDLDEWEDEELEEEDWLDEEEEEEL
ncbi:MAG: hypothetical protein N2049_10830 [Anaerolineales bacterium]|nr:hypothetical protein [Anaerolineales bacterium]MCX7609694.1 hypothetical protein [Anaerolineales bacterium]MDW8228050.1 hypothetical protein [Anaerolineales bacterium]